MLVSLLRQSSYHHSSDALKISSDVTTLVSDIAKLAADSKAK